MTSPHFMDADTVDRFATARAVADAVLYEGYVLYPYRASSRKNQVRFQWGVIMPRAFAERDGSERWSARTECLVDSRPRPEQAATEPVLYVRVRCLQTQRRRVEAVAAGSDGAAHTFRPVDALEVDGTRHVEWDEAVDRIVDLPPFDLCHPGLHGAGEAFTLEGGSVTELVRATDGMLVGRFVRERMPVQGAVRVTAAPVDRGDGAPLTKVTVTVENTTRWLGQEQDRRDDAMPWSLVAVHTMLAVDGAVFVSLLDPPDDAVAAAQECRSDGTYPVLVGSEDVMLSSPIILYDHPEVAEQSPGDLYDSLEIDEILALRVMTLTDEEKSEARGTDSRAAAIIERCDGLSPETMSRLHGQMRPVGPVGPVGPVERLEPQFPTLSTPGLDGTDFGSTELAGGELGGGGIPWWDPAADASVDPWSDTVTVAGVELAQGSPVRLRPSGRSDAQDMFLVGRCGTVAGVFADVDGGFHLAVTLDDDPAAGELVWQGRYLYFHPDEVEPLAALPAHPARTPSGAEEPS